jgi:hypothetical protein
MKNDFVYSQCRELLKKWNSKKIVRFFIVRLSICILSYL